MGSDIIKLVRDASMNFFIDYLRKGTYVFEYELMVSQKGVFSNGNNKSAMYVCSRNSPLTAKELEVVVKLIRKKTALA
jgi:hypothetical protein